MNRLFNLPNLMSLVRVPLAAVFWLAPGNATFALSVMVAAALSDVLDGWFARTMRRRQWRKDRDPGIAAADRWSVGTWLDPACDKIFVTSALVALTVVHRPSLWLVALTASRELLLVPVVLIYRFVPGPWSRGYDFTAGWPGKLTTVFQFIALSALALRHPFFDATACVAGTFGVLSVLYYLGRVSWKRGDSPLP